MEIFLGTQNNQKICGRAHVSQLYSSVNEVQPNLFFSCFNALFHKTVYAIVCKVFWSVSTRALLVQREGGRECSLLSILSPFYVTNVLNIIYALKVLCYPKSKYEFNKK